MAQIAKGLFGILALLCSNAPLPQGLQPSHFGQSGGVAIIFLTSIDLYKLVIHVTWSLTFELLFYALVTASFALPARLVRPGIQLGGVVLVGVLIWTYGQPHSRFFLFLAMLLEFMAGFIVGIYRKHLTQLWMIIPCILVAIIAFALGTWLYATDGSVRIFTFGTGALALVIMAIVLEQSQTVTASKFWVALGDSSYTLYLAHSMFLTVFYAVGLRDYLQPMPTVLREIGFFTYLGVCLWVSRMVYIGMERPVYRWVSALRWPTQLKLQKT